MGIAATRILRLIFTVEHRTHGLAEPPFRDHIARHLSGPLNIIGGTCGDAIQATNQLFGETSAKQAAELTKQLTSAHAVAIFFGQVLGYTQGTAAGNNSDLVHWIVFGN